MSAQLAQLRLAPPSGAEPLVLNIDMPERALARLRELPPRARLEVALRAPEVLEELVVQIAHLHELSDLELQHALTHLERDIDRIHSERTRRREERDRCQDCGVHEKQGHLLGCSRARQPV